MAIERGHGSNHGHHHRHRVRVAAEAPEEPGHLLMNHGVIGDVRFELVALFWCWQFAVIKQVTGFQKVPVSANWSIG